MSVTLAKQHDENIFVEKSEFPRKKELKSD